MTSKKTQQAKSRTSGIRVDDEDQLIRAVGRSTMEEVAEIVRLKGRGHTARMIMSELGISKSTYHRRMKLLRRQTSPSPEKAKKAAMQEIGKTVAFYREMRAAALEMSAADLIQPTHWPNIDLIGAQLNLYWAEFQIPVWRMAARGWKLWDALSERLAADGVLADYDLVFIDTPPALGYLTINGLSAADILLVPLGASFLEFDSTGRFFDMLHSTFQSIEEGENIAARALGRPEMGFEWDAVRAVITRFDGAQQGELAALMQAYLGRTLSPHRQDFTALIGQAGEQVSGIYEADYRDFNRETYARGRETFDATYAAFKRLLLGIWRRAERAQEESRAERAQEKASAERAQAEDGAGRPRAGGAGQGRGPGGEGNERAFQDV